METPVPVPPPSVVAPKKVAQPAAVVRRPSTSVPVIRRSEAEAIGRPKREIHPPPPKDLPYADVPKKHRKTKRIKDDGTIEQLKYCGKILQELHRKQHYNYAHPFYEPVGKLMAVLHPGPISHLLCHQIGSRWRFLLIQRSSRSLWIWQPFAKNLTTKSILQLRSFTMTSS